MKNFCVDWDEFKDSKLCNAWVATAIIGSGIVSAGASIFGSQNAAKAQEKAAQVSAAQQQAMYDATSNKLAPYRQLGQSASDQLAANNYYTTPIKMDEATLQNTPGYQFNLTQGLKATQNSAAARGLGVSGAALKGAATFATGLADNTYQNQFNNANTNQTNAYNRLKGLVDTGENASAQTGIVGANTANQISSATIGAGNAAAAASNATGGAIGNLSNNIGGYAVYKGLYGGNPTNVNNGYVPNVNGGGIVAAG